MPRVVAKLNARVRAIWTLLRWQKGISNAELRALSGLESVQASRTLAALAEKFPGAIEIDRSEKRRSEEHTSDLQSLMRISSAVFGLKKHRYNMSIYTTQTHQQS